MKHTARSVMRALIVTDLPPLKWIALSIGVPLILLGGVLVQIADLTESQVSLSTGMGAVLVGFLIAGPGSAESAFARSNPVPRTRAGSRVYRVGLGLMIIAAVVLVLARVALGSALIVFALALALLLVAHDIVPCAKNR